MPLQTHTGHFCACMCACGILFVLFYDMFICSLTADATQQPVSQCLSNTTVCWQAFQESICHCLQTYCLNYSTALLYLDSLKPREDFGTYVKVQERSYWCVSVCVWACQSAQWEGHCVPWQCSRCCVPMWERTHRSIGAQIANNQFSVTAACQWEECHRLYLV